MQYMEVASTSSRSPYTRYNLFTQTSDPTATSAADGFVPDIISYGDGVFDGIRGCNDGHGCVMGGEFTKTQCFQVGWHKAS